MNHLHPSWRGGVPVCLLAAALLAGSGCVTLTPDRIQSKPMLYPAQPATVFVASGAGDFRTAGRILQTVLSRDGYPIETVLFDWSHGKGRVLADQVDYPHARREGMKLAALILEYHAAHPERPLYVFAHSAGGTVAVSALEHLPPGVVERAVLISPSLSARYDLRPALRSVKQDMHVFYSSLDTFYLGVAMRIIGTSDRYHSKAAGCVGFYPIPDPDDPDLLKKLIQRPWERADRKLGNNGGHFGDYQPDFLRVHIIPLFNPTIGRAGG